MSTYSSREPFNDDPEPWTNTQGMRFAERDHVLGLILFDPRPEFDRPQSNPMNSILLEFRRSAPWDMGKAAAIEVRWLSGPNPAPVPNTASRAQIEHARKVLTRLASPKEES